MKMWKAMLFLIVMNACAAGQQSVHVSSKKYVEKQGQLYEVRESHDPVVIAPKQIVHVIADNVQSKVARLPHCGAETVQIFGRDTKHIGIRSGDVYVAWNNTSPSLRHAYVRSDMAQPGDVSLPSACQLVVTTEMIVNAKELEVAETKEAEEVNDELALSLLPACSQVDGLFRHILFSPITERLVAHTRILCAGSLKTSFDCLDQGQATDRETREMLARTDACGLDTTDAFMQWAELSTCTRPDVHSFIKQYVRNVLRGDVLAVSYKEHLVGGYHLSHASRGAEHLPSLPSLPLGSVRLYCIVPILK